MSESLQPTQTPAPSLNDRVTSLLRIVDYARADSAPDLRRIQELRYKCYLREGMIQNNKSQMLEDEFDNINNTYNFGLHIKHKLVAAVRISVITKANIRSPTMSSFSDIIMPYLDDDAVLIDPSRLIVDDEASRLYPNLIYAALRVPFLASGFFGASAALAAVRGEHMAFYKRFLSYKKIAEPRPYLQLSKRLGLMIVDFQARKKDVESRYHFFQEREGEGRALFDRRHMNPSYERPSHPAAMSPASHPD